MTPPPDRPPPFAAGPDARDLSALRGQVAAVRAAAQRAGTFRGFRSVTVGFSALAAVAAAWADLRVLIEPPVSPLSYDPDLWAGTAAVCLLTAGGEIAWRARPSAYGRAMARTAAGQFLPCVAAGGLLTLVVSEFRQDLWDALPGLWALLFGLGVCSCARLLPRVFWAVGAWYLAAGCVGVALSRYGVNALFLGVTFGAGQAVTAGLLYALIEKPEADAGRPEGWGEEGAPPPPAVPERIDAP